MQAIAAFRASFRLQQWARPAPLSATTVFALLLWFWHAPGPYAATFGSTLVYWTMHLTVTGSALWLWCGLLDGRRTTLMHRVAAGVASTVQMGFLGALITLAPRPLYAPHLLSTASWDLTQLQDQQLGGAIMWVPGCGIFLAVAMLTLWPVLSGPSTLTARHS